ncbi:MAG TPA: glycine zipper family protein [Methylomirabilota bacterium]|nr:glycine zipper family protein [Methylomirabilota bacterium]
MHPRWGVTAMITATMVAGGCMSAPSGPTVQVLPGVGKPFEQFQVDVGVCRDWAARQVKGAFMDAPAWEVQRRYDNAYVQCMYAKGNQVPGRAPAQAAPPAPPAGPPPPPPPNR